MSHHETQDMLVREIFYRADKLEKRIKERKEFSRLLVILSVAFITITYSLHAVKTDVSLLHYMVAFVQLFAIFSGVKVHRKCLDLFEALNSLHNLTTDKSKDDFFDGIDQTVVSLEWWSSLQEWSFLLAFAILVCALFPWQSLLPIP